MTRSRASSKSAWRDDVAGCRGRQRSRPRCDVREVGAGETGCLARDRSEVDVVGERLAARVHVQDRLAAGKVGR